MTKHFDWKWELEERMPLHRWLKQHYELLQRKRDAIQDEQIRRQCYELQKVVLHLQHYVNMTAVVRRDQQGAVGADIEYVGSMVGAAPYEIWRDRSMLVTMVNGLTG